MDLGLPNLVMILWFWLEPIFNTALAASKNDARFKSAQK